MILFICLTVLCLVFSIWVALAPHLWLRFNSYNAYHRRLMLGSSVPQIEFFRHFSGEEHHGFLEDICAKVIDRLYGKDKIHENFWQYKVDTHAPGSQYKGNRTILLLFY